MVFYVKKDLLSRLLPLSSLLPLSLPSQFNPPLPFVPRKPTQSRASLLRCDPSDILNDVLNSTSDLTEAHIEPVENTEPAPASTAPTESLADSVLVVFHGLLSHSIPSRTTRRTSSPAITTM